MTNGEKYKTAQERAEAFIDHCEHCWKTECSVSETIDCFAHWLDLEAEEEKPLPCPFCKHPDVHVYSDERSKRVYCPECGFSMPWRRLDEDIYDEYNRVAKAAAESEAK